MLQSNFADTGPSEKWMVHPCASGLNTDFEPRAVQAAPAFRVHIVGTLHHEDADRIIAREDWRRGPESVTQINDSGAAHISPEIGCTPSCAEDSGPSHACRHRRRGRSASTPCGSHE